MPDSSNPSSPPSWNLSDLFDHPEDPRIDVALRGAHEGAKRFEETYRPVLSDPRLSPEMLLSAIRDYEALQQAASPPGDYAGLFYSADTSDEKGKRLLQRVMEEGSEISKRLIFFHLALLKMPPERADPLIENETLAPYRHFLAALRAHAGHDLSEPEEMILEEKANTSHRAFVRLFEETTSNMTFLVRQDGEQKTLSQSEVLALLYRPERETRREAAKGFSEGWKSRIDLLAFIMNTLLLDKSIEDRMRRYETPEAERHLANELDDETVETVVRTCEERFDLVARYYRMKREILGLDTLTHYDRYAPLFDSTREVSFEEARAIVLESFDEFSPVLRDTAARFFDGRWIDAEPRPGKRGGAFCSYVTPDRHPYILMNFIGRLDDVGTLAHELGHGVHAYLSRGQTLLNYHGTLPLAELASTFAEMLVFEKLSAGASPEDRLALLAEKIEGSFATIFRQASMYRFEQALHRARREEGELPPERIGEIWQEKIQAMFGDSVYLEEEHRLWWSYVTHFIASPFYVYAYSFGELLMLAIYRMYQQEGSSFAERYLDLLRQGGSQSPRDLMARLGIDLRSPDFWRGGMEVLQSMIDRFESTRKEANQ